METYPDTRNPFSFSAEDEHPPRRRVRFFVLFFCAFSVLFLLASWRVFVLLAPPPDFRTGTLIEIPSGYTLEEIAVLLKKESVIRSPLLFTLWVQYYRKERGIQSGAYLLAVPLSVDRVAERFAMGDRGVERYKIILPEGTTIHEMSEIFGQQFPNWNHTNFINDTKGKEGYLFPDTYFFFSTATSGAVASALQENFLEKTASLRAEALLARKSWSDIVIMASLIEEEAATALDRRIVAGILWKRLSLGMRLQVDATFMYTIGKGSLELTQDDLQSDSPYNTYRHGGLPPTPITNPGLDAIIAALHPDTTPFLYYLSDKDGVMHYAKTFEEHKRNKERYL